jgi:Holliday junction resolvase
MPTVGFTVAVGIQIAIFTRCWRKSMRNKKVNSKEKGARFERSLASKFREYGYEARRTAQYCGNTGDASDVVGLPGLHIEAKHQEKMYLYDWMAQAKRDAEAGGLNAIPTVFHKKNNAEILVTLEFDDFMTIYREWEASMALKEV